MAKEIMFYRCRHCGNIIQMIYDSGVRVVCCGEEMSELVPNTVDAAVEKHLPVVTMEGNLLTAMVGSVTHPMTEQHYIMWICVQTDKGSQIKYLSPDMEPKAVFALEDEKAIAVYEYCNLHGLWKTAL